MLFIPVTAIAESVLTRINRVSSKDVVELYCSFTTLPVFRSTHRNKRVDIILEETVLKTDFQFFKEDDKIVKILPLYKNNKTILSLFFRYPPQKIDLVPNEKENKLTIRFLLGNPYSSALPSFASKLSGLTLVERTTKDYSNPLIASPYAADWKSFFKLYESKWQISLPVQYTMLPYPAIQFLLPEREENKELLTDEIYNYAKQALWHNILPLLIELMENESDPEKKKKLALTYGETLSRNDNFADAYKQFYLLAEEYKEEEIGFLAKYLLIHLRARFEDPFVADFEFRNLNTVMTPVNPLTPFFLISQIETALATEQYQRMKELLDRDDIGFPGEMALVKELRQADYLSGSGDIIKAYIGYQLLEQHEILQDKIYSLNGYCNTLYQQKQFEEASTCYNRLATRVHEKEKLGLINFRKYMAELHYKNPVRMIDFFSRIENTYPGTNAGFRGAMKKTDLSYLYLENWKVKALLHYKAFAERGMTRTIREEASFKVALIYRLRNDNISSVTHIMKFLRDFRGGELHREAQALLIELFPLVIQEYVDKKMYMKALVLAKQNRKLFVKNWVDIGLLAELAASYNSLGIYNEASKLYLYLIALSSEDEKEQYYLPVISAAFDHGSYNIVEDYADQYSFRYPQGLFATDILQIRIKSLLSQSKYTEAITILPESIPDTESFSLLAATLYFHENYFTEVTKILDRPITIREEMKDRVNFMLGESYYQTKQFEKADTFFTQISDKSIHHDQSLYRRAEWLISQDDEETALTIYRELAETGDNPLWVKMAQKAIQYRQMIQ